MTEDKDRAQALAAAPREPMNTEGRMIDGVNVLYQYGQPVPAFETWQRTEPGRERRSLDGEWKFARDPDNQGVAGGWHSREFDDSGWGTVRVPSSWDLYDTPNFGSYDGSSYGVGSAFYDGYAWFRTRVALPPNWDGRFVRLMFLGVNYRAQVFVNGSLVGEHEGGHTPFALDISGHLEFTKDNVIAVRVYRRPWWTKETPPKEVVSETEVPYKPVDYWPYAGITRSVFLEATSQVTVTKLLTAARDRKLEIYAVVYNHGVNPAHCTLLLHPGDGTGGAVTSAIVTLAPGEVRVLGQTIPIPTAQPWDIATPQLYRASATLFVGVAAGVEFAGLPILPINDGLSVDYGMRSIDVAGGKLLLNGRSVFLKGLNWHEETAASGRSLTIEEYDRELQIVLDAGANFIRNSVYNRHPYVYEFADKHGLLVMDDIDNMWLNGPQQQLQTESYGLSRSLALAMAWNQANHPAVILWCLQNESEGASAYRSWLADMKSAVKSLDRQNRPVTWASASADDPAFDLADVIGFNEYYGNFEGEGQAVDRDLGAKLDIVHQRYPDKPILITENGSWSILGTHGAENTRNTEEWHSAKFQLHWNQVVQRQNFMAGYVFWALKDYKQRMNYNHEYNGISAMGLITFDGHRRLVYEVFRTAPVLSALTIPRAKITATATSSHVGFEASKAIDGNDSTMWHSEWTPYAPLPQSITLYLGGRYNVRALRYLGRQDDFKYGLGHGRITKYRIFVSDDGSKFTQVSAGTWADDPGFKFAYFNALTSYVRLEAVEGKNNLASAAEIAIEYR